jgi:glycosyl transferase family 25
MVDTTLSNVRVYVINLDRSTQRLQEITAQLSKFGLSFHRIAAVDGKLATSAQQALLDEKTYQLRHGKISLPGELGCYLSHVEAIREFLKSEYSFAVILEDDAILENGFIEVLLHLSRHPNQWDMVKLSGVHSGSPVAVQRINDQAHLSIMFSKCTCSSAYMINRKAAKSYSNGLLPMTLPYDHEFDKGWTYGIKVRAVTPFVVTHNEQAPTTIVSTCADSRKLDGLLRWPAHLYRIRTEVQRVAYALKEYLRAQFKA